ncbi:SH3 domain-containing protein [Emticicia sp. BO119]|uniref:SH3 domain-containing protein n=1 Tax=Emticicia sp. BO119 TaxID=2757768 RepID=UPI0015F11D70|nr:SH3 domain-containing protein [Emticicia sp. BO119]MBA4849016.1 hypothetical protein [Emticicia sp. BO119]
MAQSILEYISKQQQPQTDVLIGKVAIAAKGIATVYESVNKQTGADSGRKVMTYLEGSSIGIIQKVGYIGQRIFASITLYSYFKHPYLVGNPTVRQVLIGIEKLAFEGSNLKGNQSELYATSTINIRSTPSVNATKVESYAKNQLVGYTDGLLITSTDTISTAKWYKIITVSGKTGFVRSDIVSTHKPAVTPIPKPLDNTNTVVPTDLEKSSILREDVLEIENKPLRKVLIWGSAFLVISTITIWFISKINGSKNK